MNIAQIDFKSKTAPEAFSRSLQETGFAVLSNHPIAFSLLEKVYENWGGFFASEEKFKFLFDLQSQSGYFPFKSENAKNSSVKDLKEFFHIYPHTSLPSFITSATLTLRDQLNQMGLELLGWLQQEMLTVARKNLSLELPEMVRESDKQLLRVLHYPPLTEDMEPCAVRAAAHEDINLITLLPSATEPGLQVKDNFGNWYDVPCDPGSIIVNAGDMLQLASGGYFRSTTHRVVNPVGAGSKKSRFSLPLFIHPRKDVYLGDGLTAEAYLSQRLLEIGLKASY